MPDEADLHKNALLTEYQVTQHYIDMIERARWNATAVIIGSLVIGGTLTTAWRQGDTAAGIPADYVSAGAAVVALLVAWFWWLAMKTWRLYQRVSFGRMRQIETALGMKKNLMIGALGDQVWRVHTSLGAIILTVSLGWLAILIVSLASIYRRL